MSEVIKKKPSLVRKVDSPIELLAHIKVSQSLDLTMSEQPLNNACASGPHI